MMVDVSVEDVSTIVPDVHRIFAEQWDETEHWRGEKYNPNEEYFYRMIKAGAMVCVTARVRETTEIIGLLLFVCGNDPLDQKPYATDMGFYVHPNYRGGTVAFRMVGAAVSVLDELPLSRVLIVDKEPSGGVDLSRLLARFGFQMHARAYVRRPS
jgi:GNAT superfamily N-acetyltransferase